MAYVTVPKDLTKIKSKVMFNLTKRQLICFSAAVAIGLPLFFLVKDSVGTTTAALCMVLAMLPMFLLAMYEKNGQPLEVIIRQFVEVKFLRPKERPYQTNNFYAALARQEQLDKEVRAIVKGRQRATGSPIRRRTAYRLSECIRTGFAALQTGGIPSALSLRTSTISLRSRTTKPPFLKPFAICITRSTLLSACSFP